MSGAVGHLAGKCAEDIVAMRYQARGCEIAQRRWRGAGGEIDLIVRDADTTVFVEVKKSRDFATAAARLSGRQMRRIYASAGGYLQNAPDGLNSEARFDVALVNAVGDVEILQNVYMQ